MNGHDDKYATAVEAMRLIVAFTEIKKACWQRLGKGCKGCPFNMRIGDRYLCDMFSTQTILEMAYDVFTEYLEETENDRRS